MKAKQHSKVKEPKAVDWREDAATTDWDPDDQELVQTPQDVVAVLGFDPKEEEHGVEAQVEASEENP